MPKSLRQLWQENGYSSAKQLADELGFSQSTMSRYESNPEDIPTSSACAIADALGVSVDEVLGRELPQRQPSELQQYYDSLDENARGLFDEFVAFSKFRRDFPNPAKRDAVLRDMQWVKSMEKELLNTSHGADKFAGAYLYGTPEERRAAFAGFVREWFNDRFTEDLVSGLDTIDSTTDQGFLDVQSIGDWYEGRFFAGDRDDFFTLAKEYRNDYEQHMLRENKAKLDGTVRRLMGAYDILYA